MARRRKRSRKRNPSGFWAWASDHWFLTFLLAGSAMSTVAIILTAGRVPALPPPSVRP